MGFSGKRSYHHGNLKTALLQAGEAVLPLLGGLIIQSHI